VPTPHVGWGPGNAAQRGLANDKGNGIAGDISISSLQKILKEREPTHRAVNTWKESDDPDFENKRIDRLTRKKHNPPVLLSFDEAGPLRLKPAGGGHWHVSGHSDRVPAAFGRKGTWQLRLAFSYCHGKFFGRLRKGKRQRTCSLSSVSCAGTALRSSTFTS